MRTTLDIDIEILNAVKGIARRDRKTAGAVLSELARQALTNSIGDTDKREPEHFFGFQPFAANGRVVSEETVERLREREGI